MARSPEIQSIPLITDASARKERRSPTHSPLTDDCFTRRSAAAMRTGTKPSIVSQWNNMRAIDQHGPDSVALYVSGQFLTEDYYVANKLMKGFIGTANIDTNSRLCMASSVAGHVRAFGEDIVPGCYEDIEQSDLVVLVGSNMAWCHPVLYQRLVTAKEQRRTKIVVIDPRQTATCNIAGLHLAIRPGSDVAVFAGLLVHLAENGQCSHPWMHDFATGYTESLDAARKTAPTLAAAAAIAHVPDADLKLFYSWFADTERTTTLYSQGINQSSSGTDKVNAIVNCHLATGRIGRPGMGPFSLTGQPNAMGGREVGGLANQLAAHMSFGDPADVDRARRFWNAPRIATRPGLKAVDLFEAALDGRIKTLWILSTNPAASMPRAERVRAALGACPFVVVSDCWPTDTTRFADIVLPAATWGEKDGTVTNSERCISRQRAFRPPPGEALPDWWMLELRGRKANGLGGSIQLSRSSRHFPRACGPFGIREYRTTSPCLRFGSALRTERERIRGFAPCPMAIATRRVGAMVKSEAPVR
jgi:assimilatory nitrate reductase catalytic subunit